MASSIGNALKVSVFGQSHSEATGIVVDGLPSGFKIDMKKIEKAMARRAPGKNPWSTPRKEADEVNIICGLNERGLTCGAPLAVVIPNTNTRSSDYDAFRVKPRPGHADYTAQAKWGGAQDVAGGGHFSARLTAPLMAVGSICTQMLEARGIKIAAHLAEVAGIADEPFCALENTPKANKTLAAQMHALADGRDFPCIEKEAAEEMIGAIASAFEAGDSLGGVVECVATGLPVGIGEPMFGGLENLISNIIFGIPAVKGIEFGRGFEVAKLKGSENNDPFAVVDGEIRAVTNNAGGILGGISSGAPLLFRAAFKPTSSISLEQKTVDMRRKRGARLQAKGRHDPCVAPRAVPAVEAATAIALLDAWLSYPPVDNRF